ncbi:IS66 family insertion sequence element accessory protein TnpB [Pseudomonas kielensis]|uniref:IS66 family insertion sequence element accessory protein TnpB n=1 Tax=Pseudomonas kielensis TaxID=2762577 RepID=UPI002240852E|nr:IS66 family insertion sequence element accessory protein TnpB [Pseudomonas kielensis]UZM16327.1 IS66 family insertion sequence element accessory protein TnpB [Pseudomonas kielensis]
MMRPDAKVEKVYLYPKAVDFRKSIDGLAALVELDIKCPAVDWLSESPFLFVPSFPWSVCPHLRRSR